MKTSPTPAVFDDVRSLNTFAETWEILRCSESKGHQLIASGELSTVNVAGKRLVLGDSIKHFLEKSFSDPALLNRSVAARRVNLSKRGKAKA
jgi:hypothetical protein